MFELLLKRFRKEVKSEAPLDFYSRILREFYANAELDAALQHTRLLAAVGILPSKHWPTFPVLPWYLRWLE